MSEIDPVEFGKLVQAVETMSIQMDSLTTQVDQLKQTISGGRGLILGIVIAAGGMGAAASKLVESMFKG